MISRLIFERFGRKLYVSVYRKKFRVNFMLREQFGVVVIFCLLVENALSFENFVFIIFLNKLLNYLF